MNESAKSRASRPLHRSLVIRHTSNVTHTLGASPEGTATLSLSLSLSLALSLSLSLSLRETYEELTCTHLELLCYIVIQYFYTLYVFLVFIHRNAYIQFLLIPLQIRRGDVRARAEVSTKVREISWEFRIPLELLDIPLSDTCS